MNATNKILAAVTLIFLINIQSIYAVTHTLLMSPNSMREGIQKIAHLHDAEAPASPQFEVNDFQYNYHLTNKKNYVSFILSSTEFVSYYIYLINDDSTIFHETSGFINQDSKKIDLTLENITPGDYDLVVEVYNSEKVSAKKIFPLIFK
ncbi:hypothetical protein [Yersinia artesiana]|uniref:hypothetical protein n=1 Tax=Yersinia artesiana TaxID=2890315 RepID=UPI0015832631|nr:hypothetical protein [Yersinia artesiana]